MRNILSALARALRGTVSFPFWLVDHTLDAFKTAFGPRVSDETAWAADEAAQVIAEPTAPKFDEMKAVVDALRIIVVNAKHQGNDKSLPMKLDGIDYRWSEWLIRIEAPEAQRALNAEKSRPSALLAHRSGEMKMLGISRVRTEKEYKTENAEDLAKVQEDLLAEARDWTPEQDQALLDQSAYGMLPRGEYAPKC